MSESPEATSPENGEQSDRETELETLLLRLVEQLGPEHADVINKIRLTERDLRIVAHTDPSMYPALERAEILGRARISLEELLSEVRATIGLPPPEKERTAQRVDLLGQAATKKLART